MRRAERGERDCESMYSKRRRGGLCVLRLRCETAVATVHSARTGYGAENADRAAGRPLCVYNAACARGTADSDSSSRYTVARTCSIENLLQSNGSTQRMRWWLVQDCKLQPLSVSGGAVFCLSEISLFIAPLCGVRRATPTSPTGPTATRPRRRTGRHAPH